MIYFRPAPPSTPTLCYLHLWPAPPPPELSALFLSNPSQNTHTHTYTRTHFSLSVAKHGITKSSDKYFYACVACVACVWGKNMKKEVRRQLLVAGFQRYISLTLDSWTTLEISLVFICSTAVFSLFSPLLTLLITFSNPALFCMCKSYQYN